MFTTHRIFKRLLFVVIYLITGAYLFFFSVLDIYKGDVIQIEAEDARSIESPFELVNNSEAFGGQAVTTTMRSDEMESFLEYQIKISENGHYRFWANCYWPGGCNNSFILQFNNGVQYVFGNDKQVFDQWHWVKGPLVELHEGVHTLKVWNKEAFSQIDQFILSNRQMFVPIDSNFFNPIHITFENGMYQPVLRFKDTLNYEIVNKGKNNAQLLFIKSGNYPKTEYFKINSDAPDNFFYTVKFEVSQLHSSLFNLKVLFDIHSQSFFYCQLDNRKISLRHKRQGQDSRILTTASIPGLISEQSNLLQIAYRDRSLFVSLNDRPLITIPDLSINKGSFAIGTETGGIYIYEILIEPSKQVNCQINNSYN